MFNLYGGNIGLSLQPECKNGKKYGTLLSLYSFCSVLNCFYSVLNCFYSVLNCFCSVLNCFCSVLNCFCSVLNCFCSVLNCFCSVLNCFIILQRFIIWNGGTIENGVWITWYFLRKDRKSAARIIYNRYIYIINIFIFMSFRLPDCNLQRVDNE